MNGIKKLMICISLSLMSLLCSLGFAGISSNYTILGTAEVVPPEELFITSVTTSGASGASGVVNNFSKTVVNSRTNLGNNSKATVTYRVTVYNNTDITYGYNGMIYSAGEGTYDNDNIKTIANIERRTAVRPGEYLSFNVTVSYKNTSQISNTVLNSVITYEFLPLDEIPETEDEIAVGGVLEQFKKILNNEVVGIPSSYSDLINQMNDNSANGRYGDNGKTYIGNVSDASNNDKNFLANIFQGQLSLNINGNEMPVTIIIKRENIDGGSDDEMVIYMTTDDLQKNSLWASENAPVYLAVFKNVTLGNGETSWIIQGDMYHGKAAITSYNGFMGNGSFNTDRWTTDAYTYKVTDKYSYNVNSNVNVDNLIPMTDANANNELIRLLKIADEIRNDGRYDYEIIEKIENLFDVYDNYFSISNGNVTIINGATRANLVPIIKIFDELINSIK